MNNLNVTSRKLLIILLGLVFFAGLVLAIPQTFNIHGKLTDSGGSALDGTYGFNFSIYDAYTGGNLLWNSGNVSVTTDSSGIYNLILVGIDLSFSEQYYLGVAVGGDSEMSPRINLTSSPYAFRAQNISVSGVEFDSNVNIGGYDFIVNNSDFFVDVSTGFVGIGTTGPGYKLHVSSATDATAVIDTVTSGTTMLGIRNQGSGAASLYWDTAINDGYFGFTKNLHFGTTAGIGQVISAKVSVLNTGNVGIGTTAPSGPMHVVRGTAGGFNAIGDEIIIAQRNNATTDNAIISLTSGTSGISQLRLGDADLSYAGDISFFNTDNSLRFQIANSPKLTVASTGNVGIGTTTPNAKLEVNGSINISGSGAALIFPDGTNMTSAVSSNAGTLDGYDSTYFMPLNKSVSGDFDFNGGWQGGGLSISGGDLFAQTGWFYNISSLSVSNLDINGSMIPYFNNQFDFGSSLLRWRDLYLSGEIASNGTGDNYFLGNVGIGTITPQNTLNVVGDGNFTGNVTAIYFKGDGSLLTGVGGGNSSWNQSLADTIYVPYTNSNQNIVLGDYNFSVGTSDFFVNSNGNVGIGTTSPSVKFQVKGNTANEAEALAYFTDSEGVIMASIEKDLIGHGFLDVMATGGGVRIHLDSNNNSYFNPLVGNFGIGTTTPLGLFHVNSSAATFIINGTSGNVGIGTASPQNTLNVVGDANITGTVEAAAITATGTVTANPFSGAGTDLTGTAASLTAGTATVATTGDSATAFFSTGTIEDARIASTIARDSEVPSLETDAAHDTCAEISGCVAGATVIPSGAILMFNSSCPSGWTYLSAMAGKFARGSTTYGGTGGSDTHTHTDTLAAPAHTHTVTTNVAVSAHSHTLAAPAHTHTGPSHTHTGPSHTHAAGTLAGPSHTHTGPSHTHAAGTLAGPSHTHTGPSHTHTLADGTLHAEVFGGNDVFKGAQGTLILEGINSGLLYKASWTTVAGGTGATGASGTAAVTGSTAAEGTGATGASGTGAVTGSTAAEGTGATGASGTGATGAASATALTGSISSHTVTNNQVTSDGASATALTGGVDSGANVPAYVNVVFCLKD